MKDLKIEYRRKLPHLQPKHAVFFVTFNLKGALPKHIVANLSEKYSSTNNNLLISPHVKTNLAKDYSNNINELLDSGLYGNTFLKDPAVAKAVANSLHYLDGKNFKLICYCIMSNHVHFIAYKLKQPLYKTMHSLKSYTANECNKLLNRQGAFWQREYYDRIIRDENDLERKIKYTINNPVKAGIVAQWQHYEFTYCRPEFLDL